MLPAFWSGKSRVTRMPKTTHKTGSGRAARPQIMANATVKSAATQAGALKKNAVSVLGIFGPKADLQALVRMSSGRIKKVKPGSRVGPGKVVAIDENGVVLRQSGQNRRIDIPGS